MRHRTSLDRIESGEEKESSAGGLTENDPRLVLRRLTREGVGVAHDVDGCARFLFEASRACPSFDRPRVEAADLSGFDRPSLRILARLHAYGGRGGSAVELVATGEAPTGPRPAPPPLLEPSFERLVATVRERWALPVTGRPPSPAEVPETRIPDADVAQAFSRQNYERVLAGLADEEPGSLLIRSLVLVNLGAAGEALREIDRALLTAPDGALASLHYLAGLIRTKSCPDWERARAHFEEGLTRAGADGGEADAAERAWLLNGGALLETLRALKGASDERRTRLTAVLQGQEEIIDLSLAGDSPEMLYLRYNVLANTALLLEAMGLFGEAHHFWTRSFGPDLDGPTDGEGERQARLPYLYRKGVLALKAGEPDLARAALEAALDAAGTPRTWLMKSRARFALGCVELEDGRKRIAAGHFEQAACAAEDHRDPGHLEASEAALESIAGRADTGPIVPPSKLPTYFGHIDLDPEPGNGISEKLARAASGAPMR